MTHRMIAVGTLVHLPHDLTLGPARVSERLRDELVELEFLHLDSAPRRQAEAALARFPLYPGQRVDIAAAGRGEFTIVKIHHDANGLRQCIVTNGSAEERLPESILIPARPLVEDPVSYFESLQWGAPHDFYARMQLSLARARWYDITEGAPTFRGARVRPLAHQLYTARRILEARIPRFILADEVGLGKTIEAGLVIQALLSADPERRVLVISPGSMGRQWLCELYLRFGGRAFAYFQGARPGSHADRVRTLRESQLVIVSTSTMLVDSRLRDDLVNRTWDLVVIDEAHQLPADHVLYPTLRTLAQTSEGLLALSATPSKRDLRGLASLLALVSPETYEADDDASLQVKFDQRRAIWDVLTSTVDLLAAAREESEDGEPDRDNVEFIIDDWKDVLSDEPEVERMLARARDGEVLALDELVAYVQEHYRVDHRIIRTRRCMLEHLGTRFAQRHVEYLDYEPTASEVLLANHLDSLALPTPAGQANLFLRIVIARRMSTTPAMFLAAIETRLAALDAQQGVGEYSDPNAIIDALSSDPGPEDESELEHGLLEAVPGFIGERAWLEQAQGLAREWLEDSATGCERHRGVARWLGDYWASDPDAKVLVFAQDSESVCSFVEFLTREGLGAQFASFHQGQDYEQNEAAALRFQRDASCRVLVSDELGGEGRNFQIAACVVHLDTPLSASRVEQRIGRLDRIGREMTRPVLCLVVRGPTSHERNVQSLHATAFEVFTKSIGGLEFALPRLQARAVQAIGEGRDFDAACERMRSQVAEILDEVDRDFQQSLDSSQQELREAGELAELFEDPLSEADQVAIQHWLGSLGIDRRRESGGVKYYWDDSNLDHPIAGLRPKGDTPLGTYSRATALDDESLQYFAPGHYLIDAALAALESSLGRTTMVTRELGATHRGQIFLLVVGGGRLFEEPWGQAGIPAGLRTKAYRCLWPTTEVVCVRVTLDDDPKLITDPELEQELRRVFSGHRGDEMILAPKIKSPASLWPAVRRSVELGAREIDRRLADMRSQAAHDLEQMMRLEMGYLRGQLRLPEARERDAANAALRQRELLLESVQRAQIVVEAVALIAGV